jgi:hypothetical protein
MRTGSKTITIYDVDLDVEFEISEYIPAVHTLSNGDPGYPAEGGDLYITSVSLGGVEIYDLISDSVINEIENKCLEN